MLSFKYFLFFIYFSCLHAATVPSSTASTPNIKNTTSNSTAESFLRFGNPNDAAIIYKRPSNRGTKTVPQTKFFSDDTPNQKCKCVQFYDCDKKNIAQYGTACENSDNVCCIIPSEENSFQSAIVSETELKKDKDNNKPCTCVSYDKCTNETFVKYYGAGILETRITPCDTSEICCPNEYLYDVKPIGLNYEQHKETNKPCASEHKIPDTGFSNAHYEPAVFKPTEALPVAKPEDTDAASKNAEPECACVSIDLCKKSTVNSEYGANILQVKSPFCDTSEVCCPLDSLLPSQKIPVSEVVEGVTSYAPTTFECGLRKKTDTLIAGYEDYTSTHFGEFPWMILILKKDQYGHPKLVCGGSLVSSNVVLTAAHCLSGINKEELIVRAGEYDITVGAEKEQAPHQDRSVIDYTIHPFYKAEVVFNDMALLQLNEEFKLKPNVYPVCIPSKDSVWADPKIYDWNKCIAAGWGKDAFGTEGTVQKVLKKVELSIIDREECEKKLRESKLGPRFKLHTSFMCTAGENGKDTCKGDGGGPLFCELVDKPGRYIQVGIVSWGINCGTIYPSVYSSLHANMKWLTYELHAKDNFSYNSENGLYRES